MKKKIFALVLLAAVLCGLAACAGTGRVKAILTSGNWTTSGEFYLRFYPDGTGMQYQVYDGYARTKERFEWKLDGDKLSMRVEKDDGVYDDFGSGVIQSYSEYTIVLLGEDDYTLTLHKELKTG